MSSCSTHGWPSAARDALVETGTSNDRTELVNEERAFFGLPLATRPLGMYIASRVKMTRAVRSLWCTPSQGLSVLLPAEHADCGVSV